MAAAPSVIAEPPSAGGSTSVTSPDDRRLSQLGAGDSVTIDVYGQPDMNGTVYVADDGTISVSLAGAIEVSGLSPVEAAAKVEQALKNGGYLVNPHVTLIVTQSRSQRVSVLGEVKTPGRYAIEPNTTVLDLLAEAGGVTETSADVAYITRTNAAGEPERYTVHLHSSAGASGILPSENVHTGDSVFVPKADQYYIYGEVTTPNRYRLEPGTTVIESIARAGGLSPRGSERRVDIKRLGKNGEYVVLHARPGDLIQPDDIIRVKESIF